MGEHRVGERSVFFFVPSWCPVRFAVPFCAWPHPRLPFAFSPPPTPICRAALREAIWNANLAKVNAHNAAGESWTMAMNEFADLTGNEFAIGRIGGYVPRNLRRATERVTPNVVAPASVDWTTKGAVTPVKNQQQCGSCWSFSSTGSLEGNGAIFGPKQLVSLSEQQLVDCSTAEGNQGCNGGLMDDAFQYVIKEGGLCTESAYPYTATGPNKCKAASCTKQASSKISGFTDVTVNSAAALEAAIAQQPVSIAVEADQDAFQLYSGGVVTKGCGAQLDHGVLAVGYGTEGSQAYWKVKNSWGASWGQQGYILLGKGTGMDSQNGGAGVCGLLSDPSYPKF